MADMQVWSWCNLEIKWLARLKTSVAASEDAIYVFFFLSQINWEILESVKLKEVKKITYIPLFEFFHFHFYLLKLVYFKAFCLFLLYLLIVQLSHSLKGCSPSAALYSKQNNSIYHMMRVWMVLLVAPNQPRLKYTETNERESSDKLCLAVTNLWWVFRYQSDLLVQLRNRTTKNKNTAIFVCLCKNHYFWCGLSVTDAATPSKQGIPC